jgi:hypothetical protein
MLLEDADHCGKACAGTLERPPRIGLSAATNTLSAAK